MNQIPNPQFPSLLKKACLMGIATLVASSSHADLVEYFPASFQENLRATLDLSTRITHNDDTNNNHHRSWLGHS